MAPSIQGDCPCTEGEVNEMMARAPQFLDEQIAVRNNASPSYWRDMFPVKSFPDGVGLNLNKLRFYPDYGPQYDGFDGWRKLQVSRSAAAAEKCGEHDACATKFENVQFGHETLEYSLMQRDLATDKICIKDIRTFWQYLEFQNQIYKMLGDISNNIREQLNRNAAYGFANNHVALPGLPTDADPKKLPNIPSGVEVGKLTYRLLKSLYPSYQAEAGEYSIANLAGLPMFGVIASSETLDNMVMEDEGLRQDIRYCSGMSCDLIKKYNFLDAIGPFVLMPDENVPRYNRDAAGNLIRVFPLLRDVPIQNGVRVATNMAYHNAEFERVLIMVRGLFTLRTRRALTSVGGQTNFGPEPAMFEWEWFNVKSDSNPFRRYGKYITTGEVGIEPGDFTDVVSIIVKRRPAFSGIEYWPEEVCPNGEDDCDQTLGGSACPCPQIINQFPAVSSTELTFVFDRDPGLAADDEAEIEVITGGSITVTVQEVSADGLRVRVDFGEEVCVEPGRYIGIVCNDTDFCTADVMKTLTCGMLGNTVDLILSRPIRAGAGDTITLITGDGDTVDVPVTAVDINTLTYTVTYTYAAYCSGMGIASVCVPTATEATCPGCDVSQLEDCEDESS